VRVGDFLEQNARTRFLFSKFLDGRANVALNQVVAKNYADLIAIGKVLPPVTSIISVIPASTSVWMG
jgi:hypothetical protein